MRISAALALVAALALGGTAAPGHATTTRGDASGSSPRVLAISVDGLNVAAIDLLGRAGTPTFHRLLDEGAGTLNARTEYEQTVTLPNHTSMVTGRRIDAAHGGHGVTWNDDRPGTTVQVAAGHPVGSVFSVVHASGGDAALYTTKSKFRLFERSWPAGVDTFRFTENQRRLVRLARNDLADGAPSFTFLHVSLPDRAGHRYGGMSAPYLDAVRRTDRQLGTVLRTVRGDDLVLILTSDHGFATDATDHSVRNIENYRIPFLVWGSGVAHGDLYAANPAYRNPHGRRPAYAGRQPVRNGDVANLALDLLGLDAVPGSELDDTQALTVD